MEDECGGVSAPQAAPAPEAALRTSPGDMLGTHERTEPLVYGLGPLPPTPVQAVSCPCSGGGGSFAAAGRFIARSQPSKRRAEIWQPLSIAEPGTGLSSR